jgi:predicted AlkP superfamily phosphohydrolase/phosphomutase
VIGLDGLEPTIVDALLASGDLPNLARLRAMGGFSRIATTTPAQTPVAWSTFATGLNPGGHGIFDFIRRDPATYLPDLALNRYEQKNAFVAPKVVNQRHGIPVWDRLAEAGIASTILRCPCTYPADPKHRGNLLAGMGVPDLRGGLGTATFYTTRPNVSPGEAENVVQLNPDFKTYLIGPRNPKDRSDTRLEMTVVPDRKARSLTIKTAGSQLEIVVREHEWSDWLPIKFKLGLVQNVRGMVRFRLIQIDSEIEFYATPINFDPDAPLFPISSPPNFATNLANVIGTYHTTGMIEDHAGLSNGRLDETAFLDQCAEVWNEREAMMLEELKHFESGLFYCLFDTPDRVQHMFWRFREPDHPANRGRACDHKYAKIVEDQYRRGDAVVGQALKHINDQTLLIVLSDHGFNTFQRGANLNTWLHEQGLLALKPGAKADESAGEMFKSVDWSRTKAYALGLGGIYLNLKGREGQGIVTLAEAESVKTQIIDGLTGLIDPIRAQIAIRNVRKREQAYKGDYVHEAPDLLVDFAAGYRASWSTSLGGFGEHVFEDNIKPWGGDHIIDPTLVPGILFMNHPFRGESARLEDMAPTILAALGAPSSPTLEGVSLLP